MTNASTPCGHGWQSFLRLCHAQRTHADLIQFFDLFLTDEEKENLATRVLLIQALLAGELSQREIAKQLHVSIAKITRGSNMLKRMDKAFLKKLFNDTPA